MVFKKFLRFCRFLSAYLLRYEVVLENVLLRFIQMLHLTKDNSTERKTLRTRHKLPRNIILLNYIINTTKPKPKNRNFNGFKIFRLGNVKPSYTALMLKCSKNTLKYMYEIQQIINAAIKLKH